MGKINLSRVVAGGLLAGVVINIGEFILNMFVLGRQWEEAMKALNRPASGNEWMIYFILLGFGLGLLVVWMYAAIRTRFGPGPTTAICAGLVAWALANLYPNAGMLPMQLFPGRMLLYSTLWSLFELLLAALAGAWLYQEKAPA
jgi:hypothetical protein